MTEIEVRFKIRISDDAFRNNENIQDVVREIKSGQFQRELKESDKDITKVTATCTVSKSS